VRRDIVSETPGTPYVRLFVNMFDDDKFVDVDDRAALLYVHAILWSKGHNRDGFVPEGAIGIIARRWGWPDAAPYVTPLLLAGLLASENEGYRIPNFARWQVTVEEQLARAEALKAAGRASAASPKHHRTKGEDGRFIEKENPRSNRTNRTRNRTTTEQAPNRLDETKRNDTRASSPTPTSNANLPSSSRSPSRAQDEVWDAVIGACGLTDHSPTASERGAWNRAVKEMKAAGATPAEISRRARAYRKAWPGVSLTPQALARHWSECVAGPGAAAPTPKCPKCHVANPGEGCSMSGCPVKEERSRV